MEISGSSRKAPRKVGRLPDDPQGIAGDLPKTNLRHKAIHMSQEEITEGAQEVAEDPQVTHQSTQRRLPGYPRETAGDPVKIGMGSQGTHMRPTGDL